MIRRRSPRGDDSGIALVVVLMSMLMITAILLTSLAYTVNNLQPARTDADGKAALAAAQAGIDDYVSRLTADTNYWTNAGVDGTNPAFTTGQRVVTSGATFTYRVLSTTGSIQSTGAIKIMATGTARTPSGVSISRTLYGTLRVAGFLDFIYLSDYEVADPSISGSASCGDYYYASTTAGSNRRAGNCSAYEIQWSGTDTVTGPFHSNDALQITGATTFSNPQTESSWPAIVGMTTGKTWWGTQSAGTLPAYIPKYAAPISLPSSNASLLNYVAPNMTGNASLTTGPGCYYSGPTEIIFQGASMRIRSPQTTQASTPAACYAVASASSWQTITPIPAVIYVGAAGGSSCSGTNAGITYPLSGEVFTTGTPSAVAWSSGGGSPAYAVNYTCSRGTAYVQGTANTSVTVASADDVVVTGDLLVPSLSGGIAIGIIAGNAVWVYHPLSASNTSYATFDPANNINASILALNHSFLVENSSRGTTLGALNITGAIAQRYRGPVGATGGANCPVRCGYTKNYVYDSRLLALQPPYFLQPTVTPWRLTAVAGK